MSISYDKLWQMMKANKMNKTQLKQAAQISQNTITKLNNGQTISMETMVKFCKIFHCDIGDLMEVTEEM